MSLLMVVGLCVYPTLQSSIALSSVTTVMSSPVLPSTLTTVAKAPSSNGKTSLEQHTETFPNVQVDIQLDIASLHYRFVRIITTRSCTGFRYTLRPLHRGEYYLPSPCPLVMQDQTQADTVKTRFCDVLTDFVDKDQINCTTSSAFIQCPKTTVVTIPPIPPDHPNLNP